MVFLSQSLFSPEISTISEGDISALACRASIRINMVCIDSVPTTTTVHIQGKPKKTIPKLLID